MAGTSASVNLNGGYYQSRGTLTASFNENSTSTTNNTSNITATASLYTPSASWYNTNNVPDHLRIYWHDNHNNTDVLIAEWGGISVDMGQTITASGTFNATHNDDGNLSGYAFATWTRDGGNANAPANTTVVTGWVALTTIARASQPTIGQAGTTNLPDFDIGDTITIYTNRKSNSFTHTVTFNYGSTSVEVATGVGASCTFDTSTIANDIYALIPNDNVYSNTISVKTYNGSTLIGTKTCAYNAHVVNSDPIFSDFAYADISSYTSVTGNNQYFIQNASLLRVRITTSNKAVAQNGASITQYEYSLAGVTGVENYSASSTVDWTPSNVFDVSTSQTLIVTARDSRGNTTSVQKLVQFVPYSAPSIVASCERQANFENDTTISISGAMSLIQINNVTKNAVNSTNGIQYRYKESTSSTWGSWTNVASSTAGDGSVSTTDFVISLDNQKEWDFEFKITDKITSTTITRHVGQGQPQFFIGSDGRTSVGGVPQIAMPSGNLGQLEVNGNAYANGNRLAELPITNSMLDTGCVDNDNLVSSCVKYDNIDFATFPWNKLELVAIGRNSSVAFATQSFIGVGFSKASGQSEILNPNYISWKPNTEDMYIAKGRYLFVGSVRFNDVSSNNNVYAGVSVTNGGTTYDSDDIRRGAWAFTNQRITVEFTKYIPITTDNAYVRFFCWQQSSNGVSRAQMLIFRIGDIIS